MRKINVSRSFFSNEGEFLDAYELAQLTTQFGDSEGLIAELQEYKDELPEIEVDPKALENFWSDCRQDPLSVSALEIGQGTYQTSDQFNDYEGKVRAFINCWHEPDPKPKHTESKDEQLTLF